MTAQYRADRDKTGHNRDHHDKRMILDLTDAVEITSFTITTVRHRHDYHQTFTIPDDPFFDLGIPFVLSITSDRREALHELRLNDKLLVDRDLAHATKLDYLVELMRSNRIDLDVRGNKEATFDIAIYALVGPALFSQRFVKCEAGRGSGRGTACRVLFDNPNIENRAVLRMVNGCQAEDQEDSEHDTREWLPDGRFPDFLNELRNRDALAPNSASSDYYSRDLPSLAAPPPLGQGNPDPRSRSASLFPYSDETKDLWLGDRKSSNRPSSRPCAGVVNGEVLLNGQRIFDRSKINEDAFILNASVLLQQHNVITLDLHGHKDASVLVEVFPVDAEAPVVTVEDTPPAYTNSHEAIVAFAVSEPALTKCSVDGEAATLCSSPFFLEDMFEGSHELVITATDRVGRNSEPVRVAWVNDFTPPTLFFVGIEAGQTIVEDTLDIRLGGSEEIIDKSIFLNAEEIGEGWHSLGSYFQQLIGTATDLAGNLADEIVVPFFYDEDKAKQFFHYAFDSLDSPIEDISLHGRDGISNNTVFGDGYTDRAALFDGNQGFVEVSLDNPIVFPTQAFSLSLWIKPIDASGDVFTMSDGSNRFALTLIAGKIQIAVGGIHVDLPVTVPADRWAHLALSIDQETYSLYIGGALVHSGQIDPSFPLAPTVVRIGQGLASSKPLSGAIDEVILFKTALSQAELCRQGLGYWDAGVCEYEAMKYARVFYDFEDIIAGPEADQQAVQDRSSFNNHGILNGPQVTEAGKNGKGLSFVDGGDYVLIPSVFSLSNFGGSFSTSVWLKPDSFRESDINYLLFKPGLLELFVNEDFIGCYIERYDFFVGMSYPGLLRSGQWTHVALSIDQQEVVLYVDGNEVGRDYLPEPLNFDPSSTFISRCHGNNPTPALSTTSGSITGD